MMHLQCKDRCLDLSRPVVMGILNVTPDSFSDGGRFVERNAAIAHARAMAQAGAAIIDVGGESTRPGAEPVAAEVELARVVPVIEALRAALPDIILSVDTSKPEVIEAAGAAGADLINDVRALRVPGALQAAAASGAAACLMHMQGEPPTMQRAPHYESVVEEVRGFLAERVAESERAGIPRERLLIDPGFGFGKTLAHNLQLLRHLSALSEIGLPVLVGLSRKSMTGHLLDKPVDQRLESGLVLAALAVWQGAAIVRTHDVGPTVEALAVCQAVRDA
ncbi:MAG: dihydropteroate synthase [Gammaproteobacteria bacterium]|nr:dihydropteroate synthase [Gammaproteobacteria bacterium]